MKPENMTILTVDDTPANIRLLTHYLEKQGYRVLTAEDGFEGFKAAIQHHPDLVLLDIMMPGTDGYEVCELLKAEEETRDIPIVFLTAKADVEDRIKGFELGAVDYITKPFNLVEISARVRTHLTLRHLEKERLRQQRILLQTQKLAGLGRSYAEFLRRLSEHTADLDAWCQGPPPPPVPREDWERAARRLATLRRLTQDLIAFSESAVFETERIKVLDLLDAALELVRASVPNGVRFALERTEGAPIVNASVGLLHQALLTLLLNAAETAVGGGQISVSVGETPAPDALKASDTAPTFIRISFTDASVRKEPPAFDAETGLYGTAKNNLNAGVRLTAARAILEAHRGALALETDGRGLMTVSALMPPAAD
jgi:CheY-like chemotaxis protein